MENELLEHKVPFHMVANDIYEIGLNPYELAVYGYLCRCGNNSTAFPSYKTIAEKTGMSRKKAINVVKDLVENKLLTKTERRLSSTENATNIYVVNNPSVPQAPPSESETLPSVQYAPNKELNINNININKNIGNTLECSICFEDFLLDYNMGLGKVSDNVLYYISYYLTNVNRDTYKEKYWLEIVDNLEYNLDVEDKDIIGDIIEKYKKTQFDRHSLYHSTFSNVLKNRKYEINGST